MQSGRIYIGMDNTGIGRARRALRTDLAGAVIRAAVDWGASHIALAECGRLLPDQLPAGALHISTPLPWGGLDETYGAAILIGPDSESPGWGGGLARVCLGGVCVEGPGMLTALIAGGRGVPVAAAVGCDDFTAAMKGVVPEIEAVMIQRTLKEGGTCRPHPAKACKSATDGVACGLRRLEGIPPVALREPLLCEADYLTAEAARRAALIPGVSLTAARSVSFVGGYEAVEPILALIVSYL